MGSTAADASRLHVYVSYCGADTEFAHKLIDGLKSDGRFDVSFDPDTTIDEDDWKELIGTLIIDADAVVYVLSPEAAQTCEWEAEYAHEHSKQMLSVLCRPLGDVSLPDRLHGLKPIRFDGPRPFDKPFQALVSKLTANNDWLREHTRLLTRARRWEEAGRQNNMLLAGTEVMAAKLWTLSRPDDAPKPTDLHIRYISTSEAVEAARRTAVHEAHADLDELEALAQLQTPVEGFRRFANQAYMVVGCWLAVLAVLAQWQSADARKQVADVKYYAAEICKQPAYQQEASLPLVKQKSEDLSCKSHRTASADNNCADDDLLCSRLGR